MESYLIFVLYAVVLLVCSMAGVFLPRIGSLGEKHAHILVALSSGIFLGLLFLMLLPEAVEECEHGDFGIHNAMYALLGGFALILAVDFFIKGDCAEGHSHKVASFSSLAGLSVHAVCDGMALAATFLAGEEVGLVATIGMCIHKFVVLFSLSSSMLLADESGRTVLKRLFGFSLITPLAGIVFMLFFNGIDVDQYSGLPLAFAAGTFMYVAIAHMLPDALHDGRDWKTVAAIVVGILLMLAVSLVFPHVHH